MHASRPVGLLTHQRSHPFGLGRGLRARPALSAQRVAATAPVRRGRTGIDSPWALRAAKQADKQLYNPSSAKDAIETGLKAFNERKDYVEAARLFNQAMQLKPNDDEARAALYNLGCAYTKLKQWQPAADAITRAINDHRLKLSVALKDDDLQELRERREWVEALTEVKGGLSRQTKLDLRSEAKAPFRFPRIILLGGLLTGASIGLLIITLRLIKSLQGGEGAPDFTESIQNFGINSTAVVVLGALLWRDTQSKQKSMQRVDREEQLSRLQVTMGPDRQLPLLRFRGQVRPVILAGTKAFVERALKEAEPQYLNLRDRGVSVIPVITDAPKAKPVGNEPEDRIRALKKEFAAQRAAEGKGFGGAAGAKAGGAMEVEGEKPTEGGEAAAVEKAKVTGELVEADRRWRLEAYDVDEWKEWVQQQRAFAKLPENMQDCWIQVQLDGTVRASGVGAPSWAKLSEDLPILDSFRTRFGDGVGTNV